MTGRRIFITGVAGFIGSALEARLLQLGDEVVGIDNYLSPHKTRQVTLNARSGDVRQPEFLLTRAKGCDAIVHLAAAINIDMVNVLPEVGWDINVRGTMNVLEVSRRLDLPVVFASSSEVYGTWQSGQYPDGISEAHTLDGQSPYAASKIAGDRMCHAWAKTYGLRVSALRSFNTFGPGQSDDGYGGVIAKFVRCALAGRPATIFGDGTQKRDWMWIDDAVDAYLLALDRPFPGPVNFGTGSSHSVNTLLETVAGLVGIEKDCIHGSPRAGEVQELLCDNRMARSLGWTPKVGFEEGLRRYVHSAKAQETDSA